MRCCGPACRQQMDTKMNEFSKTEHDKSKDYQECRTRSECKRPGFLRRWFYRRAHKQDSHLQRGMKRLTSKLHLADAQRDGLEDVFKEFGSLMRLSHDERTRGFKQIVAAMDTERFDADKVRSGVDSAARNLQSQVDNTIAAFGAWFDTLNVKQRDQLGNMLTQGFRVSFHSE